MEKKYDLKNDKKYNNPYIDKDEWKTTENIEYHYIHGGFKGTTLKFSFYFPKKEEYEGKFFHFVSPVPGSENASMNRKGIENKIAFCITNGAYFIETNMGGFSSPSEMKYQGSAQAAEYSRVIARKLYGEHRPYGYIYGGSGGGFKTMSCIENTKDVWDGAVPYIIGTPYSIPNDFTIRAHVRRLLREKFPIIVEALEPGGSKDMYKGLNKEEKEALKEITDMGFPPKAWFHYDKMDAGALPVLAPAVGKIVPEYYKDFWEKTGYLGADKNSSVHRDRIRFEVIVENAVLDKKDSNQEENQIDADDAWHKILSLDGYEPYFEVEETIKDYDYLEGLEIKVLSGKSKGFRLPIKSIVENKIYIAAEVGLEGIIDAFNKIQKGDRLLLDNSNYLALQTFHRHQVPDDDYPAWDMFKDENKEPIYPQCSTLLGPKMAYNGAGSVQSGDFIGKMIIVAALVDESAFPWQPDWYRELIKKTRGGNEEEYFRLWYMDNSLHDDSEKTIDDLHYISYLGGLHQALLDLSNWVEKGIKPAKTTEYSITNNQLSVPKKAKERNGIQPIVELFVNEEKSITVNKGEKVSFKAYIEVPQNAGEITFAEWSFEGEEDFPVKQKEFELNDMKNEGVIKKNHVFKKKGIYFVVVRVKSNKTGDKEDIFTQVLNIDRVRVIVK